MDHAAVARERAQNLWTSFSRKVEPVAQATQIDPAPEFSLAASGLPGGGLDSGAGRSGRRGTYGLRKPGPRRRRAASCGSRTQRSNFGP